MLVCCASVACEIEEPHHQTSKCEILMCPMGIIEFANDVCFEMSEADHTSKQIPNPALLVFVGIHAQRVEQYRGNPVRNRGAHRSV